MIEKAGRDAFIKGWPKTANPFSRGTVEYVQWLRGYNLERKGK